MSSKNAASNNCARPPQVAARKTVSWEPGLRWRLIPARANGQLAFGAYTLDNQTQSFEPDALLVLTLRGTRIEEMTAFRTPAAFPGFGLPDAIANP